MKYEAGSEMIRKMTVLPEEKQKRVGRRELENGCGATAEARGKVEKGREDGGK